MKASSSTRSRAALAAGLLLPMLQVENGWARSYSYEELDNIWDNRLGPPNAAAFQSALISGLIPGSSFLTHEPETETMLNDLGISRTSLKANAENGNAKGSVRLSLESGGFRHYFVVPLPAQYAAYISRRQMELGVYLDRHDRYLALDPEAPVAESPITEGDMAERAALSTLLTQRKQSLARRQRGARIELYLVHLARYLDSPNAATKCLQLKAAYDLQQEIDADLTALANPAPAVHPPGTLATGWEALGNLYAATKARFETDMVDQGVCALDPTANASQQLRAIRIQAADAIREKLYGDGAAEQGEVYLTVEGMNNALTLSGPNGEPSLNTVKAQVQSVDAKTAELLELEASVSNRRSNISLVANDSFGISTEIASLDAEVGGSFADYEGFKDISAPFQTSEMQRVAAKIAEVEASLSGLLSVLESMGPIDTSLSSCSGLAQLFSSNNDAQLVLQMNACMGSAKAYIENNQDFESWEIAGEKLAEELQELSTFVLLYSGH